MSDLSQLAKVEKRLHEFENRFHSIFDGAVSGILVADVETKRFVDANPAILRMLGYSREELLGMSVEDIHPKADLPRVVEAFGDLARRDRTLTPDIPVLRKDGVIVFADVTAAHFQMEGRPCVAGFFTDVTQRVATEAELARYRTQLEALVEARTRDLKIANQKLRDTEYAMDRVGLGIHWVDADTGRFLYLNQFAAELLGYTVDECLRLTISDVDPSFQNKSFKLQTEALRRQPSAHFESMNLTKDGRLIPVEVTLHFLMGNSDEPNRFIAFVRDITRRKEAEDSLVRSRTLAEEAARAKSEFLANMSHEIRTPLNGVLGFAQIGYRDNVGRGKAQEAFARILDSGKLLLTIINDILDFSKIEAGKLRTESIPFDPCSLVDTAVNSINDAALAKELQLIDDRAPDLPLACIGDPMRITQILLNLLSNAVKFTSRGGLVKLSASNAGNDLVFRVTDSGIGMSPEHIQRLFTPFDQADNSTTRKFGGTGLGLAISARLASLMGGTLDATGELGHGSTFTFRLPLIVSDQAAPHEIHAMGHGAKRLAGLHILVAEDNNMNQLVLDDFLRREGATVKIVGNGCLALETVERGESFDIVLMDVQMPEMDGIEATGKLRKIAPALPVVGQTAHALKEEHDRCLAAGMVGTVTKPIDIEILVATLLDHVSLPDDRPTVRTLLLDDRPSPGNQIIAWDALIARYLSRPEFIDRLVELGVQGHEKDGEKLQELIGVGDLVEISRLAHTLKGLAGNLCAAELEKVATRVMHAAAAESPETLAHSLELVNAVERLMIALKRGHSI